jgi:hypothetical protein
MPPQKIPKSIIRKVVEEVLIDKVKSEPPVGFCQVVNLYVNPSTGKLVVEYNNIPKED